jgi:hypothetical protein
MNADKIKAKQQEELRTVNYMIALYCSHNHGTQGELCPQCQAVAEYAKKRTLHCPHIEHKSYCSVCKTHCYEPTMRERIREIMRYSGPRMLLYRPFAALRYLYYTKLKHRLVG